MPYADDDKKRSYQREWLKKKKQAKPSPYTAQSAFGTITYEELQSCKYDRFSKFEECVKEAKFLIKGVKLDRLRIAALAIQACHIRHGGDAKDYARLPTLKRFATAVGIPSRTIHRWVQAYTFLNTLNKDVPLNFTAAQVVMKVAGRQAPSDSDSGSGSGSGSDPVKTYLKLVVERDAGTRAKFEILRYLQSAAYNLSMVNPTTISPKGRVRIHTLIVAISEFEKIWRL